MQITIHLSVDLDRTISAHASYDSQSFCDHGAFSIQCKHVVLLRNTRPPQQQRRALSLSLKPAKGELEHAFFALQIVIVYASERKANARSLATPESAAKDLAVQLEKLERAGCESALCIAEKRHRLYRALRVLFLG